MYTLTYLGLMFPGPHFSNLKLDATKTTIFPFLDWGSKNKAVSESGTMADKSFTRSFFCSCISEWRGTMQESVSVLKQGTDELLKHHILLHYVPNGQKYIYWALNPFTENADWLLQNMQWQIQKLFSNINSTQLSSRRVVSVGNKPH